MTTVEDIRVAKQISFSDLDVGDTFLHSGRLFMKIDAVTVFCGTPDVELIANCISVIGTPIHMNEYDMVEPVNLKISIVS